MGALDAEVLHLKCIFCQRSTGLLSSAHAECREKHERALAQLPGFFLKLLDSAMPAGRFRELLGQVAAASFIPAAELRDLTIAGMTDLIASKLKARLLTDKECDRVAEILRELGLPYDPQIPPYDLLLKTEILRELDAGLVPNRVDLRGVLPIELGQDEAIIWVFNNVTSYVRRVRKSGAGTEGPDQGTSPVEYFTRDQKSAATIPLVQVLEEFSGDLMVTNRYLHLLSATDRPRRIPIFRISGIECYSNATAVHAGKDDRKLWRVIKVDDPWFAANMLIRLNRRNKRFIGAPQIADQSNSKG